MITSQTLQVNECLLTNARATSASALSWTGEYETECNQRGFWRTMM